MASAIEQQLCICLLSVKKMVDFTALIGGRATTVAIPIAFFGVLWPFTVQDPFYLFKFIWETTLIEKEV